MSRNPISQKVYVASMCLVVVYLAGVIGYMILEDWSFPDALYMTVITVSSVGFGEVHSLDPPGRIFTMFLIMGGMGAILYGFSNLTALIVEGELQSLLRSARMDKKIDKMKSHYILCGLGRTGSRVLSELVVSGRDVVAVDQNREHLERIREEHPSVLLLEGDATKDEVLTKAGIKRAAGLIAALTDDKDNLYVVLSARGLNEYLRIVSKAVDDHSREKLFRAGAHGVVCPNAIGGLRMASEMIRPTVVNFLDVMLREKDATLRVEEVSIGKDSSLVGQTLQDSRIAQKTGLLVVALKLSDGSFRFNPPATEPLRTGETVIVIGDVKQVAALREMAHASVPGLA